MDSDWRSIIQRGEKKRNAQYFCISCRPISPWVATNSGNIYFNLLTLKTFFSAFKIQPTQIFSLVGCWRFFYFLFFLMLHCITVWPTQLFWLIYYTRARFIWWRKKRGRALRLNDLTKGRCWTDKNEANVFYSPVNWVSSKLKEKRFFNIYHPLSAVPLEMYCIYVWCNDKHNHSSYFPPLLKSTEIFETQSRMPTFNNSFLRK